MPVVPDWFTSKRQDFEVSLASLLSEQQALIPASINKRLQEAMAYAMLNGGKRVRPLLCYAAGLDFGVSTEQLTYAAAAIEAVHVYSLVHDDLPCMDDDVLRRGKPTCHVAYDEPTALLVGDALQSLAFEWLTDSDLHSSIQVQQIRWLSQAIGQTGMAGGQQLDLMAPLQHSLTLENLEIIHRKKTGALIEASIVMGALAASNSLSADDYLHLKQFGRALGLAFQVMDDILDATADTAALGKTAGKDAEQNKATYVRFLGIEQAKEYAQRLDEEASHALTACSVPMHHCQSLQKWLTNRTF